MTSFSERMGFVKPPEFMQLDDMTEELSNLLFNFCVEIFRTFNPSPFEIDFEEISQLQTMQREINDLFKRRDGDFRILDGVGALSVGAVHKSYSGLKWHQKYSFCEYLVKFDYPKAVQKLNQILERENSGYRLNEDCQFVPIANQQELDEVSEAQHSTVDMVALHMNKAVTCFADREKPDYDNSIKEAVSALEALAQKITGEKKGTLGALIKKLDLHPSLREAVSKLYGYTSDGGIRHAKKDGDEEADFDTAKFVIVTASALINFITVKCSHE
jgi:hypothetical protein